MKRNGTLSGLAFVCILSLATVVGAGAALPAGRARAPQPNAPVGTAFTYQGRLTDDGSPADGTYDFEFKLYSGSEFLFGTVYVDDQLVSGGYFAVKLDFGANVFSGLGRWLEIGVRPGDSTGPYTTLTPRQELTPAPYALALPGLYTQENDTSPNVVAGYPGNWVADGAVAGAIGGGGDADAPSVVADSYATVGGGQGNVAGSDDGDPQSAPGATIGGGRFNEASGVDATVGGGNNNTAAGTYAFVGGGLANSVNGMNGIVGGGGDNVIDGDFNTIAGGHANTTCGWWSTVGGGTDNTACGGGTVAGGIGNTADYDSATVGGGKYNMAGYPYATVSGGGPSDPGNPATSNRAISNYSTIGGGGDNLAGSSGSGDYTTVGGGKSNQATGWGATVPGGMNNNAAGLTSLAAGYRAKANNQGCFAWGDSTDADVTCSNNDRWVARASGGVYFYTNAGLTSGVYVAAGGGAWSSVSDRSLKENVRPVDAQALLASLAQVPVSTWSYKSQDGSIRHIGPMAQDFYAAFGVGEDDTHITTVDADGVALAAIQGLYAENQALKAENAGQQAQIDALEKDNAELDARLSALEAAAAGKPAQPRSGVPAWWVLAGGLVVVGGAWAARRRPRGGR